MKKYNQRVENIIQKNEEIKKQHKQKMKSYGLLGITVFMFVIIVSHQFILNFGLKQNNNNIVILQEEQANQPLKFKSKEELISKIKKSNNNRVILFEESLTNDFSGAIGSMNSADNMISMPQDTQIKAESTEKTHTDTNIQVQGVDEADIVKTNGSYIYYIANRKLNVFDITTNEIILKEKIEFDKQDNIIEMYIDENNIIVLSNCSKKDTKAKNGYTYNNFVKIYVYDINTFNLIREIETEGNYLSSRKIGNDIYVISNKNAYSYILKENVDEYVLPQYKDSIISNEYVEIQATDIAYFDDTENSTYMMITSFSLDKINEKANIETYLGAGNEIYVSKNSLYVANVEYTRNSVKDMLGVYYTIPQTTSIHKFKIDDGKINYVATGKVDGALLNQFSMDEYENNFRITTTTNGENSENNLYVLDSNMNTIGKLTGLAKGERIYSTRSMGDKAYVVTYKTVDPLFVIDLSNPANPYVLGELKIPGYSSYLHPIGENYLLGFGEDTVERTYTNWDGNESVTAYANGLKMAIFDVTDYNNPKELYSVKIGGRGSYSELLYNHKALLFDLNEGIIAFPVSLYTENNGYDLSGIPKYGTQEFAGALVYDISIEKGINLRGKIQHEYAQRIIRVEDKLYTLSQQLIKTSDLKTIEELNKLNIK